ncbi:peptidase s1 and s6 chymotrypsin/hap [Flammeovirgaceae bacterium 311]|nr:peptidase s1 and s6 chymotrypsin/hap [Flammeovirgaceae bacterium 311]
MINVAEILEFFRPDSNHKNGESIIPKSIGDYFNTKKDLNLLEVGRVVKILTNLGLLIPSGSKGGSSPMLGDAYYCFAYDDFSAKYGTYNYLVYGFPSIRNDFEKSVKPIILKYRNSEDELIDDIGTCFVIGENALITARHCLPNKSTAKIYGANNELIKAAAIFTPKDPNVDLALMLTNGNPFSNIKQFRLGNGNILDEVMTMGYPPIPGFDAIQVSEIARISAHLKSSLGNIVGTGNSYLDKQDYFLISARVKGGNSGGPFINKEGKVVGVIAQLPSQSNELDSLGYGIVTLSSALIELANSIKSNQEKIDFIPFENRQDGIWIKDVRS